MHSRKRPLLPSCVRLPCCLQLQGADGAAPQSVAEVARAMLRKEGPLAFYRGVGATLLRAIPSAGIQFGAYEVAKTAIRNSRGQQ